MEVKGNYEAVQHHWVEDEDDTCVSSISNVSDPNKERRKIERAASKACITGIPENIGDGIDAKAPSKTLQELIREIKKSSSSPPPIEIDQVPPPIIEVEHPPSQSPDPAHAPPRSGSSSRHEKKSSRQGHRRSSVETPRIHTRRASMGGTTLYQTSQLAKIDSFLRGSELRLNKNGTCSFVYEDKKFTIETTAETSQFLFHCSLGRLVQWKKVWAKKLLHMMALWNEEQITKSDMEGNDQDSKDSEEDEDKAEQEVGLLRIDSSKDNPVVALILYGHADNIKSATQFQDMLDEFVDDALHFYGKLKAGPEMEEVKEEEEPKRPCKSLSSKLAKEEEPKRHCKSLSSNTCSTATALTSSLTSSEPEVANAPASTQLNQSETSPERASPAPSDPNNVSNVQDERTSSKKASVFGNIIKNLRSRHKEDIGKLAFIDPNQNSAFVVDTNAADAVKINISRQSRRWDSAHDTEENQPKSNLKRGSTFDVQQSRSRRSSAPTDEDQPNSHLKRGCTIDDGHRVQPKKGSSFNIEDRTRGPTKKSASSFRDDSSRLASLNKSASNLSRREPRSRSSRFNKSEPALAHNRGDEIASPSGKEYRRHQTSEHQRRKRTSSRPRRKVHCNESSQGQAMGEEYEKNRSRSRRSKSQARVPGAPPSRPPELERSSRSRSVSRKEFERSRSRSAFRKNGRSRSRSALRTEL